MKAEMFSMTRVWGMITGMVLAIAYLTATYMGFKASEMLPMLVTAIGGFEIFLFSQDVWLKRKRKHG